MTGKALGGAQVSLNSSAATPQAVPGAAPATLGRFPMRVLSDSNGAFVFRELPGGYSITRDSVGIRTNRRGTELSNGYRQPVDRARGRREAWRRHAEVLEVRCDQRHGHGRGRRADHRHPGSGVQTRDRRRTAAFDELWKHADHRRSRLIPCRRTLTPGDYVVGVVTSQATVPVSVQEAFEAARKNGSDAEFRRQLDRSGSTVLGGLSFAGGGRRIGSWLLQGGTDFGSASVTNPPGDDSRVFVYPTTFYPSAHLIGEATVLTVDAGEDRSGTDFHLKPVPTTRVSGRLVGGNGDDVNTALSLLPVSQRRRPA